HMFNRETFGLMKDDAIFINTARGSLVNEDDLIAELEKGRFWACLDVTDPEPPAADSPLRSLPNVTLTPHIAGSVNNGHRRIGRYVTEEIERFVAGEPAVNPVLREQLATLA
ncbi:MAG: hydroxyacid dehydrogenase, partial [Firmicutes bacterium]|nr:hydroxyacid dehydrogenase [Bacillota bacterium]